MVTFFLYLYEYFLRRRGLFFSLLISLAILFAFSAYHIRFKEDISRFLPENKENKRINDAYQYIASSNTITIYCDFTLPIPPIPPNSSASPASSASKLYQVSAIDALAERLMTRMDSSYIKSLFYSVNPMEMMAISSFVIDNMPYFLEEDDYHRMDTLLTREAVARQLLINREKLNSPEGMIMRDIYLHDPFLMAGGLLRKMQNFQPNDRFQLYDDHLFNDENQAILFIDCAISASETGTNAGFIDSLKSLIAETEKEFPGITFDSFGAAEIGLANARQIQKDTLFSMSLAAIIMLALMLYSFRSVRKIALVFASVLFGGLFALAALNLISGDVSIIAVGISSIMFGIAINYPLHFLEYHSHAPNTQTVIKDVIEPLTIGNITTVGAFLSLVFIGSDAMKDLGLFASLLLVGTILFVLFFLPHLLPARKNAILPEGNISIPEGNALLPGDKTLFGRLIARPFEKNRTLALAIILLTVFFNFFSSDTRFETNMQKINYMTDSHKKSFEKMMGLLNNNQHIMYFVTEGKDLETVLEKSEKLMPALQALVDDGEIYRIGGTGSFFPSRVRQATQIKRWEDFWSARHDSVMTFLREESRKLGFREDAFQSFKEMTVRKWEVVNLSHFNPIKETLTKNYIIENNNRTAVMHLLYMDASKAPELEKRLNGRTGEWANGGTGEWTNGRMDERANARTHERTNGQTDERENARTGEWGNGRTGEGGDDSYSIAFDAGSITRRMIASLSDQFYYVLYICGFIVFIVLFFSFGRIELSLIAFLPLALSWIWIIGIMNIFDIRFNIVNIILATFIFGQGDDYTILMTEGLMHEYAYHRMILASYKKSITLSALIMLTGMGMLIFAKHPALRSLAEVTMAGMFSVVIMAYIFPSLLFRMLTMKKGKKRMMPVTLKNLFGLVYAFMIFFFTSIFITLFGRVMFSFGQASEKKKLKFHKLLYRVAKFVIYRVPQVKTTFHNLSCETFDKPGIIICNHQAHFDLMCVMMLTPKLIILTNDWVWNSPFYGRLIRYADYYPVSNGLENAMDQLQDAIERGYSIVVFPEGTRSADCTIGRFHRGAFYLAEQLKLDLIPVMIHGAGHVLPKEDFMLRKGKIHVQVMPRITPDDTRFSKDYSPRSREVRRYYQIEYKKLCDEIETPAYYADLVMKNYIYKGAAIEREVRRNLQKNNNFATEIAAMPDEGEVTITNTGYGEYALLLSLVKKGLQITAVEPNPDRRTLAENCVSVPSNLIYIGKHII